MLILFHRNFKKGIKKQPKKIQIKFKEQLEIFQKDPYNYLLNNHALSGKFLGTRSFDVTGDVRVHYEETSDGVELIKIGTHSELYG